MISSENGEQMQILHYEHGQKYEPHADFFVDDFNVRAGGNRVATVLMYLSNVDKGGETIFPASEVHYLLSGKATLLRITCFCTSTG